MRIKIILLYSLILFSSCEDESTDPFLGTWNYSYGLNKISFTLRNHPDYFYLIDDITFNEEQWPKESGTIFSNGGEMVKGKRIDGINIGYDGEAYAFYGCVMSDGVIKVDSVKTGQTTLVNQQLTR